MVEQRKNRRVGRRLKTVIRKTLPDRRTELLEFMSTNLSHGGVFIQTEDLSLFDLGEELEVLIEDADSRFYEGMVRIVRSSRVFTEDKKIIESGFGLMFIDPTPEFIAMLERQTEKNPHVIL